MATIQDIKQRAQQVKDATQIGENTASRVGGVLVDLCDYEEETRNGLPVIATAGDFNNPTQQQEVKVPTVGAILGCMDDEPTEGSNKPVKSGGVRRAIDGAIFVMIDVDISSLTAVNREYFVYLTGEKKTAATASNLRDFRIPLADYQGAKKIRAFCGQNDAVPAAIAFFTSTNPSQGTYISEAAVCAERSVNGRWYEAEIPDNAVLATVVTKTDFVEIPIIEIYTQKYAEIDEVNEERERAITRENELDSSIDSVKMRYEEFTSKFTSKRSFYIIASDGSVQPSPNYFYIYILKDVDKMKISGVLANVGATDVVPAAIAFYAENEDLDNITTRTQLESFIGAIPMANGKTSYEAEIPTNCKMIIVTNRSSVVATPKISIGTTAWNEIDSLKEQDGKLSLKSAMVSNGQFLFGNKVCYGHLFINDAQYDRVPKIPCQSLIDIDATARLGFTHIEVNVQTTSDGVLIPFHGLSGNFGPQVTDMDGLDTYASTPINTVTYDWIKQNIRYKTSIEAYKTTIPTLDEFLACAKSHGLSVMMTFTESSYALARKYYGDNFIAYTGTRSLGFTGMVMSYSGLRTKEQILAKCDEVGAPYIHMPTSAVVTDMLNDEVALKEIIDGVHERGCLFGVVACYLSPERFVRLMELGGDVMSVAYNVNDFDYGNVFNLRGDVSDWSDFVTDGAVSPTDGILELSDGQSVASADTQAVRLGKCSLRVRFTGSLRLGDFGEISAHYNTVYSSESGKYRELWISCVCYNKKPIFSLTSVGASRIVSIDFKSSKV